jgi:diamine N-acetyltransferase
VTAGLDLRPVARDHVAALSALDVAPHQRDLVTANAKTLQEVPSEPGGHVWGLWVGPTPVGLMAMVEPDDTRPNGPHHDPRAAYLWRLMIAAAHQRRGYGAMALHRAIAIARGWHAPRLLLGVADVAHSNRGFYERHGFRDTGVVEEGDRLMVRALTE